MLIRLTARDGAAFLEAQIGSLPEPPPPRIELTGIVFHFDSRRGDCLQYLERPPAD